MKINIFDKIKKYYYVINTTYLGIVKGFFPMIYFSIVLLIILILGTFVLFKKSNPYRWVHLLRWYALIFSIYLLELELQNYTFYFLLPLSFFAVFFISYHLEKRRLLNGFLFNLFLISAGTYLFILAVQTQSIVLIILLSIMGLGLIFLLAFGVYAINLFLYWNALIVWKKENHSLANRLTLLLALALTLFLIVSHVFTKWSYPLWLFGLLNTFLLLLAYFSIIFYNFLTISILYQWRHPAYNQEYLIVLGAGLINGRTVSPLLASRIDKAIQFYHAQQQAGGQPPFLVMSGGQGSDEQIAESLAMKQYALEQGIPEAQILVETASTNTLENMRFSKEIIEQHVGKTTYRALFVTNNFHLFRAGLFAKKVKLSANGIGSKTAFYYLPNAFLREFVGVLFLHKRAHLWVCTGLVVVQLLLAIFLFFVEKI